MVELARLLLAQAVESLVLGGIEDHPGGERLLAFDLDGIEGHPAAFAGSEERLAVGIREVQFPGGRVDGGGYGRCRHFHESLFHRHLEGDIRLLRQHDQALPVVELLIRRRAHANQFLSQNLQPHL